MRLPCTATSAEPCRDEVRRCWNRLCRLVGVEEQARSLTGLHQAHAASVPRAPRGGHPGCGGEPLWFFSRSHDQIDVSGVRSCLNPAQVYLIMKCPAGGPFPAREFLPPTLAPAFAAITSVPGPTPVGAVARLAQLPGVVAGRAASPAWAQACSRRARPCWVPAHLAVVPFPTTSSMILGPPAPRSRGNGRPSISDHDHQPLITAEGPSWPERHHSQMRGTRQRRSRPEPAWAHAGDGRPRNHDIR
jgi:hypothetical protein